MDKEFAAYGPGGQTFDTSKQAWQWLHDNVQEYVEEMKDVDELTTHVADWSMFRDDLLALALIPWIHTGMMKAPNDTYWQVAYV